MNIAITEGIDLMPPPFADGLDVWSSEDGLSGQAVYDGDPNAAFVPADADFGGCLELVKANSTQQLRYTGETPIIPGVYLRISTRVKAVSGNLPDVRVAAWAGSNSSTEVTGLTTTGASVTLTSYGEVVEVSAIVGVGDRGGVDMVWGAAPILGHFGLDLTGANGGVVRIDDIVIEDVTEVFIRDILAVVDVRDYGALGDGVTDDSAAFNAADSDADGREVLVPAGVYHLASTVTMDNPTRFVGTVTMPADQRLTLRKNYNYPAYLDAFGDSVTAFEKALQSLFNNSDHDTLDLQGRRVSIDRPIDVQAAIVSPTTYEIRRVIANGELYVQDDPAWDVGTVTSQAQYSASNPRTLSNVANVANIEVGSLVAGTGVGREVYVQSKNVSAQTVELSLALWGAPGNQTYTFTRFRYVLDFAGFGRLSRLNIQNIDFKLNGHASAVMLPASGEIFEFLNCWFTKPSHRAITSPGYACQDLTVDRCQFFSNEGSVKAEDRVSLGLNVNANDPKIRSCRFSRMGTSMVIAGKGAIIVGNHWFQGDNETTGQRVAGLVLTNTNCQANITGNYIDNCFIQWGNEHDEAPDFSSEFSFGALAITGNIFVQSNAVNAAPWIVLKPYGPGHYVSGLSVTGNTFKSINGTVARAEVVDNSVANPDFSFFRNITFSGNTFNNVDQWTINPAMLNFSQNTESNVWTLDAGAYLPFGGWLRNLEGMAPRGDITDASGNRVYDFPMVTLADGPDNNRVKLRWSTAVKGEITVKVRVDNPF